MPAPRPGGDDSTRGRSPGEDRALPRRRRAHGRAASRRATHRRRRPQAQGIVASSSDTVDVRCELDGYVQLGETTHSLDTGTNDDMAAWATDSVELRMRPRDVRLAVVGEDGAPVEGVSLTLTHGEASLTATHDSILVLNAEAYALKCATPGWVSVSDTLEVSTEAFRASEEVLVRELRVERARVAVDVAVVDVTGAGRFRTHQ